MLPLTLGLPAATALAGPPELLSEAVIHPTEPSVLVLRYENVLGGLFYSDDGGDSFRIRPALSFTRSGQRDDALVAWAGDSLLVGSSEGLVKTDRHGCAVSNVISNVFVDALTTDASDPGNAYFVTSRAANGARVGLWQRDARGAITPLGASDPSELRVSSMHAAGGRIVQTATRATADAGAAGAVLRVSSDLGQSFRELPLPGAGTPRLLAVDGDRIVVALVDAAGPDPIVVSLDGGASWQPYLDGVLRVGQAALAPDGRLWLSDQGDPTLPAANGGLWFAPQIGAAPQRVLADVGVTCLAHDPARDALWLCEDYELNRFDPSTSSLCRVFALTELAAFVDCAEDDLALSVRTKEQLCSGYCGALHFSMAPLCALYDDPVALCGVPARGYDTNAGWSDPAGTRAHCQEAPVGLDAGEPDAGPSQPAAVADAGLASALDGGSVRGHAGEGCALAQHDSLGALLLALLLGLRRRRAPRAAA